MGRWPTPLWRFNAYLLSFSTVSLRVLIGALYEKRQKTLLKELSMGIKPLEDRIVVKPMSAEQTTASGLVIPDTAKEKPQEGTVIAVGPGRFDDGVRVPMDVKVGDVVLYSKYGGTEVKVGADDLLVLSARDILAIVEK